MSEENQKLTCVDCGMVNCKSRSDHYPSFCLTTNMDESIKQAALREYEMDENRKIMLQAAAVEAEGYGVLTRVQETVEFAKKMNLKKIGIATCVGLIKESRALAKILRSQGFEVFGIACKAGAVSKADVGIEEKCAKLGKNMCNPILQAMMLNEEKTELNILMGLCVGHDSLFYKYSEAIVTTLVTKDRVTGHNPVAPLYQLDSYYAKLLK